MVRFLGVVLVLVLAGGLAVRVYGKRRLAVAETHRAAALAPYTAKDLSALPVPENENAAVFLRAGALALVTTTAEAGLVGQAALKPAAQWLPEERAAVERSIAANAPALQLLQRGANLSRSSFGPTAADLQSGMDSRTLPLLALVRAARLCVADGRLALDSGDEVRLLRSAGVLAAIGRSLDAEAPLIAKLIGIAAERMFLGLVRQAAATPAMAPRTLDALDRLVGTSDLRTEWRRALAAEHALWTAAGGESKRGGDDPGEDAGWGLGGLRRLVLGPLQEALAVEALADLAPAIDAPYAGESERPSATLGGIGRYWTSLTAAPVVPNLRNSAGRLQATLSQRRMARIALALRLHAASTGSLPDSLASIPESAGADPFNGEALHYVRRADGSGLLELPGAEAAYKEMTHVANSCPFSWEIRLRH